MGKVTYLAMRLLPGIVEAVMDWDIKKFRVDNVTLAHVEVMHMENISFNKHKCSSCGTSVSVCPENILTFHKDAVTHHLISMEGFESIEQTGVTPEAMARMLNSSRSIKIFQKSRSLGN
jgi:ferredoxin